MVIPRQDLSLKKIKNRRLKIKIICGIYCIKNKLNNKRYIGLSKNCYKRWYDHREISKRPQKEYQKRVPLYQALRKYGLDNFEFSIIEQCPPERLKEREIYWIDFYKSYETGYNATRGGDLSEGHILKGEEHGMAKLTEVDVKRCRLLYAQGKRCLDIWQEDYKNKINRGGFTRMWHGQTWKEVMPEVFEVNPHPRSHITKKDIELIREMAKTMTVKEIQNNYKKPIGYGSVWDIIHHKGRFSDK